MPAKTNGNCFRLIFPLMHNHFPFDADSAGMCLSIEQKLTIHMKDKISCAITFLNKVVYQD